MEPTQSGFDPKRTDEWLAEGVSGALHRALCDDPFSLRYLKAVCEIAFFISINPSRYGHGLVQAIGQCLEKVWGDGQILATARHNLQHANLWLPLLLCCARRLPVSSDELRDIKSIANFSHACTKERIPFRDVDLYHSVWKLTGSSAAFNGMIRSARRGCLRQGANIGIIAPSDAYAITHTVFYCTDFGRLLWPPSLASVHDIQAILGILAAHPEHRGNLDLLGELVLAGRYLRLGSDQMAVETRQVGNGVQDGRFWQGPVDLSTTLRKENIPQAYWNFFLHYHTTLVCRECLATSTPDHGPVIHALPLPTATASRRNTWALPVEKIAQDNPGMPELVAAYHRLSKGSGHPVPSGAIDSPKTIVQAVEWFLVRRMLTGASAERVADIAALSKMSPCEAGFDSRLLRLVVTAGMAVEGLEWLDSHRPFLDSFLKSVEDRTPGSISADEACLLAAVWLAHGGYAASAALKSLDRAVCGYLASGDLISATPAILVTALSGTTLRWEELRAATKSYESASMAFGFVAPADDASTLVAYKLEIVRLQSRCLQRLVRQTTSHRGV